MIDLTVLFTCRAGHSHKSSFNYCEEDLAANKVVLRAILEVPPYYAEQLLLATAGYSSARPHVLSVNRSILDASLSSVNGANCLFDVVELDLGVTSPLYSHKWQEWLCPGLDIVDSNKNMAERESVLISRAIKSRQLSSFTEAVMASTDLARMGQNTGGELALYMIPYGKPLLLRSCVPSKVAPRSIPLYTKVVIGSLKMNLLTTPADGPCSPTTIYLAAPFSLCPEQLSLFTVDKAAAMEKAAEGGDHCFWGTTLLEVQYITHQ